MTWTNKKNILKKHSITHLNFRNSSRSFHQPLSHKVWVFIIRTILFPPSSIMRGKVLAAKRSDKELRSLLNNNGLKLCRITSSICKTSTRDSNFSQIAYNLTTQSKCNVTCRSERIRTLTGSFTDWSHQLFRPGRRSTKRQYTRWRCWQNAKPVLCK